MKLLEGLFGFAAFSIGYLLILAWLPVAFWIAWRLARHFTQKVAKVAVGLGVFALLFFLPFADEIMGRMYLNHLCATKAGIRVYQTVELPAEYWDEYGRPKFYDEKNGNFNLPQIGTDFKTENHQSIFPIERVSFWYFEKQNQKTLGEVTNFQFAGGWMSRNFNPAPGAGASCRRSILESSREVISKMFVRAVPSQNR